MLPPLNQPSSLGELLGNSKSQMDQMQPDNFEPSVSNKSQKARAQAEAERRANMPLVYQSINGID